MALDIAPGLNRRSFGFDGWASHDLSQWRAIKAEAEETPHRVERSKFVDTTATFRRCRYERSIQRLGLKHGSVALQGFSRGDRPTHRDLPRGLLIVNRRGSEWAVLIACLHFTIGWGN